MGLKPKCRDPVKTLIETWTHSLLIRITHLVDFPVIKNPPGNAGDIRDAGSIPGSGRSPEVGSGNPLQYSCLENPMDRGAWQATVHGVTKSRTRLSNLAHMHLVPTYWGSGSLCLSTEWIQQEVKWRASSRFIKIRYFWDRKMQASRRESSPPRIKWATTV